MHTEDTVGMSLGTAAIAEASRPPHLPRASELPVSIAVAYGTHRQQKWLSQANACM